MKLYHPTAQPNQESIQRLGLLTTQRGVNPLGLDTGFDYDEYYGEEVSPELSKPKSVHLIKDLETAQWYQGFITDTYQVPAVIFEVEIDDALALQLIDDPEDRQGYYCLQNIPASCLTLMTNVEELEEQSNKFIANHSNQQFPQPSPSSSSSSNEATPYKKMKTDKLTAAVTNNQSSDSDADSSSASETNYEDKGYAAAASSGSNSSLKITFRKRFFNGEPKSQPLNATNEKNQSTASSVDIRL